jgi:transposase
MKQKLSEKTVGVYWVGLDVAKGTFDAALLRHGQQVRNTPLASVPVRSFARTPQGVEDFLAWLDEVLEGVRDTGLRCVMESTGRYSTELAVWLLERRPGLAPAIEAPQQTSAFMKSLGLRTMTDHVAARALALYGMERQPQAYQPASPLESELREVCRYRDTLVQQRTAMMNQASEVSSSNYVARRQAARARSSARRGLDTSRRARRCGDSPSRCEGAREARPWRHRVHSSCRALTLTTMDACSRTCTRTPALAGAACPR